MGSSYHPNWVIDKTLIQTQETQLDSNDSECFYIDVSVDV